MQYVWIQQSISPLHSTPGRCREPLVVALRENVHDMTLKTCHGGVHETKDI